MVIICNKKFDYLVKYIYLLNKIVGFIQICNICYYID